MAMPDFDNTVLGLMGLSAGTYLGLKITEPKTPDVPPAPKKIALTRSARRGSSA
jgi:hypothetical protein